MTNLKKEHYIRKLRQGHREVLISVSMKILKENDLQVGDYIDLRNLKKSQESKKTTNKNGNS